MKNRSVASFIFLCLLWRHYSHAYRCQSCFKGCENFDDCDCGGDASATCDGPYCYAKLEYFTDDGVSGIQKGCTNRVSSTFLGCQYASDDRSIACFCSGELCNSAANLVGLRTTPRLPTVTCCECNEDETGDERCAIENCTRNCTGNYCYLDIVANAQGCGWGHPQVFHFLRTQKYHRWSNELTCAEYYDNYRNYMSGCTCSADYCNVVSLTRLDQIKAHQKAQMEDKSAKLCYSLYAESERPFSKDVYRRASLCRSRYCFVSWTSVEVSLDYADDEEDIDYGSSGEGPSFPAARRPRDFGGVAESKLASLPSLRSTYEISAGCLAVDDDRKVQPGCTTEWSQNERSPLTKHCVCKDKLCNDYRVIEDDSHLAAAEMEEESEITTTTTTNRTAIPVTTPTTSTTTTTATTTTKLTPKTTSTSTSTSTPKTTTTSTTTEVTTTVTPDQEKEYTPVTSAFTISPTTEEVVPPELDNKYDSNGIDFGGDDSSSIWSSTVEFPMTTAAAETNSSNKDLEDEDISADRTTPTPYSSTIRNRYHPGVSSSENNLSTGRGGSLRHNLEFFLGLAVCMLLPIFFHRCTAACCY